MRAYAVATVLVALALGSGSARAQTGNWDAGQLFATRAELEAMLRSFENVRTAPVSADGTAQGYSEVMRAIAEDEAELIRQRLRDGDFEVGDQISVTVTDQPTLSAQFTVAAGRLLVFPTIGAMPLTGLLRSELPDSVRAFIARFIRDPQVYVQSSMRIQVFGEVTNPGYHLVSADARLPDVLAQVGQPTKAARIERMRVKRGDETIWSGDALQTAIVEGRTLDQLSLRAGDVIELPGASSFRIGTILQGLYYFLPLGFAISRIF